MQKTETPCTQRPNRRLRLARERRGWTQEELAERVGASALSVGRWERGSVTPGPYYRRKLCEVYQLSAEELGFLVPLPAARTAPAAAPLAAWASPEPLGANARPSGHSSEPKRQHPGGSAPPPAATPAAPLSRQTIAALAPTLGDQMGAAPGAQRIVGTSSGAAIATTTQPWAPLTLPSEAALIGREADLRRLDDLFAGERRAPLVALYGLPGVGKTALATALVHRGAASVAFPDGALWAGLGQTPDTLSLLSGWGASLGMTAADLARHSTVESLGRALRAAIGHRRLLLVIDDAWSLADALALRVGGPNCAHLVTTRFPTVAWQFAPTGTLAVSELSAADGVALLAALAPAIVAAEPAEAHELARSVGGLPLALTLMGSYLHTQAQSGQPRRLRAAIALLRQMEQRMELARPYAPVDAPPGLAPGATQSLQATLALSEAALSAGARDMLRALACLPAKPSSFAEDAALAIANANAAELDELSDAGLLESVGPGRYTLHQTVRDYACYTTSTPANAERRLAEFYVAHVEANAQRYAQLEPDSENIVTALHLAAEQALTPLIARGGVAFAPFLEARGLYTQAEAYLRVAQTAAVALGDAHAQAGAALGLARIATRRGRQPEAERLYAQGLALAEVVGEPRLTCAMLIGAGEAAMGVGDFARAEAHLRRALTLARAANDHRRMGETFRLLGEIADAGGHFPQGDMLYYEGLALARQAEDIETVCMLLQNIGGKAVVRGDYATGEALLREGLALARANSYRQRVSALLNNLGASAQRQGRADEADRLFGESLALARAIGQPSRMIQALENLAWGAAGRSAFDLAATYADECLTLAREIDHPLLIGDCLCLCGSLRLKQARGAWYAEVEAPQRLTILLSQAAAFFEAAQHIGETVSAHNVLVRATYGLARIAAAQGRMDDAQRHAARCRAYITAENRAYAGEMTDWLATLEATAPTPATIGAARRPTEAAGMARIAQPALRTPAHPSTSPMV